MIKWLQLSARIGKQKASPVCPTVPIHHYRARIDAGSVKGSVKHWLTTNPHNVRADRANGWITWRQNADV